MDSAIEGLLFLQGQQDGAGQLRQGAVCQIKSKFLQITIRVALLNRRRLPLGRFIPEPWPQPPDLEERDNPLTVIEELPLAA